MARITKAPEERRLEWTLVWAQAQGALPKEMPLQVLRQQAALVDRHITLLKDHEPRAVTADMHVWWAREGLKWREPTDWGRFTSGRVETYVAEGDHFSMVRPPHVRELAEALRGVLDALDGERVASEASGRGEGLSGRGGLSL